LPASAQRRSVSGSTPSIRLAAPRVSHSPNPLQNYANLVGRAGGPQ
jgi:hypothetical protein